ncbi:MAG: hypothetical protein KKH98_04025 [Spirochaetes bacterium]|nr:hypothetical protein [Spirochaetota bacterium]
MKKISILVLIIIVLFTACSKGIFLNFEKHPRGENPFDPMGPTNPDDENAGPWLFMVYLDAANNLEAAGVADLNEMAAGITGALDIKIVVLLDRVDGFSTADGDWKDTRLFYIDKDNTTPVRKAALINGVNITASGASGELNMGDQNTLKDFIKYCITTYPAQKYLLDIWNHGGGWRSPEEEEDLNNIRKPICWDDESTVGGQHDTLFMNEVQQAIKDALNATGVPRLDIIYMDACLMQMIEVCYEMQDQCQYLVASEETVPGNGGDYVDILARFKDIQSQGKHTPYRFAYEIVASYRNQYYSTGDTTLSAVDMSKVGGLISALNTFGQDLKTKNPSTLETIRNKTKDFTYPDQADLYHFAQLCLTDVPGGVAGASEVTTAIANMMVKEYHHNDLGNCHGMSIYFPKDKSKTDSFYWNNNITLYDGSNGDLDFDNFDNKWVQFIQWWKDQ